MLIFLQKCFNPFISLAPVLKMLHFSVSDFFFHLYPERLGYYNPHLFVMKKPDGGYTCPSPFISKRVI